MWMAILARGRLPLSEHYLAGGGGKGSRFGESLNCSQGTYYLNVAEKATITNNLFMAGSRMR